jgi:hypothetical protein
MLTCTTAFEYDPIEFSAVQSRNEGHRKLDFKPFAIQTWFLLTTIFVFILCIAGIVAMIVLGFRNTNGFHVHAIRNHLAFRYAPAAVGTLTTIWWRTIITTLARMTPYITMAAPLKRQGGNRSKVQWALGNAFASDIDNREIISVAESGHWLLFISVFVQRLMLIFIVPLKASFIQIAANDHGWTITVLHQVGYALISIYGTLIFVTVAMLIHLWGRDTGLKWDPMSVADQLALVQGSNILKLFQRLEYANRRDCMRELENRIPHCASLKLGYWIHRRNESIWHGLACHLPPAGMLRARF